MPTRVASMKQKPCAPSGRAATLERPINSLYQQRLLAGTDRADMLQNQHQPLGGM